MAQLVPIEEVKKVNPHAETVSIEPFVEISDMVDELQQKVFDSTVFANPDFELYPPGQQIELSVAEYQGMKNIVDPIVDWIIQVQQIPYEKAVAFRYRIYREVIPMSVALAGRVIHDFDLPLEVRLAMPQTATYVYFLDQVFDRGMGAQELLDALRWAVMTAEQRAAHGIQLPPQVSFDTIMEKLGINQDADAFLRRINIENAIIKPVTFQLRGGNGYSMEEIAEIKAAGSGYQITVWTSLFALYQSGVIKVDPRELMADPRFERLLKLGDVMTRVADDRGDIKHDLQNNLINSSDKELQAEFNTAFFVYCGIDLAHLPEYIEEEQEEYSNQMLSFYIKLMNETAQEIIDSGEELSQDKAVALKVMLRAAVICYENYIGDGEMAA